MVDSWVPIVGIAVGLAALLIIILVPMSFSYLEYYQYGFLKRKSTGQVDTTTVYESGRHAVGPDFQFKLFNASAHIVTLDDISVFAADKLEVSLTATYEYFLRKEDLSDLHAAYDIYYAPILRTSAQDALKGAATVHTTREFIRNRAQVEESLFKAVRERLGGRCCEKDCGLTGNPSCVAGCKAYSTCTTNDKGLFANVRYFQLRGVRIPGDVEGRFLQALILNEETEKEQFLQDATVVRKETEAKVNDIHNEAAEITQNATAQAGLILSQSNATALQTVEQSHLTGLKSLFNDLSISLTNDHKMSFNYLRNLKDVDNLHLTVDFNQLIVGPMRTP